MEELTIGIEVLEARADELRCDIANLFETGTPAPFANDKELLMIPQMVDELKIVIGKTEALKDTLDAVVSNRGR